MHLIESIINAKQPISNQKHELHGKYKWLSLAIPEDHDCIHLNHTALRPDKKKYFKNVR